MAGAGGDSGDDGMRGDRLCDDGASGDDDAGTEGSAIENHGMGADPAIGSDCKGADGFHAGLFAEWNGRSGLVFAAGEEVGKGADHGAGAEGEFVGGKDDAVGGKAGFVLESDIAVFAIDDGIASDEDGVSDFDSGIVRAFGVDDATIVEHDMVAEEDFSGMAKCDMPSDQDFASARSEEGAIEETAEDIAEGSRDSGEKKLDELHETRLPPRHRSVRDVEISGGV